MLVPNANWKSEKDGDDDDDDDPLVPEDVGAAAEPVTRKLTAGWYRSATVAVGHAVVLMMLRLVHEGTQPTVLGTVAGRAVAICPSAARTIF